MRPLAPIPRWELDVMVHADSTSIVLAKCEANAKWPHVRPPTTETNSTPDPIRRVLLTNHS